MPSTSRLPDNPDTGKSHPAYSDAYHLGKKAELPFSLNTELQRGFTVPQVAEKHGWPEPLVWSIALEGKDTFQRFKALNWGLR